MQPCPDKTPGNKRGFLKIWIRDDYHQKHLEATIKTFNPNRDKTKAYLVLIVWS